MAAPVLVNTDFERAIARNKRNTLFLIYTLTAISGVLGYVLGWAWAVINEIWTLPASQVARLSAGDILRDLVLGSRDADPNNPAERRFIDIVEEMAIAAGLPRPRPMVVDTPALNAFASGYSPEHAMVTGTSVILQACTREELQGVIGHEMSHVADYDVRYATVVAAMAGVVVLI